MPNLDLAPVTLLLQEVQTVTSAMRRNQRWATVPVSTYSSHTLPSSMLSGKRRDRALSLRSSSTRRDDEGDLMLGFVQLRRSLAGVTGIEVMRRS